MKLLPFILLFLFSSFLAVNGQNSSSLPKVIKAVAVISYPAAAIAVNAQGNVKISVKINKEGKVESAKIISGHKFLTKISERAALLWKFEPTNNKEQNEIILTFFYKIVGSSEEEETSFISPYQVNFYFKPLEIDTTSSHLK